MKKKILILLFFLSIFFCLIDCKSSHGAETSNIVHSRIVQDKGYNSETDCYDIYYNYYNSVGHKEGTISIPRYIYDKPHWFFCFNLKEKPIVYTFDKSEVSVNSTGYLDISSLYYAENNGSWVEGNRTDFTRNSHDVTDILYYKDLTFIYNWRR